MLTTLVTREVVGLLFSFGAIALVDRKGSKDTIFFKHGLPSLVESHDTSPMMPKL